MRKLFLVVLLLSIHLSVHAQEETVSNRTYYLHLPANFDEADSVPLLVALHPRSSSGWGMAAITGFDDLADEQNFIVVYPDSVVGQGWGDNAEADPYQDVDFITNLVQDLTATYPISETYLTGFGNGGLLAYRLACEVPQLFDGLAVVGAQLWDYQVDQCGEAATPVNMLIMRGEADIFYQAHNSIVGTNTILGAEETLTFWAARNQCDQRADTATISLFADCADETRTALYTVAGAKQNWLRQGKRVNDFGIDTSERILQFFQQDAAWQAPQDDILSAEARTYVMYVPSTYEPTEPMPLLLFLHGRTGTGAGTAAFTEMNTYAEANGFIGLYPDGIDGQWNYPRDTPGFLSPLDDTVFLGDLIDDVSQDLNVDQDRVYVAGLSNGGFMAHRLACEDPTRYAAYASVAGSGFPGLFEICEGQPAVPMLIIHGTHDNNIQWDGNIVEYQGQSVYLTLPITAMIGFWLEHDGCDQEEVDVSDLPQSQPATRVRIIRYSECTDDAEVVLYGVMGGGHNYPGVPDAIPAEIAGNVNVDIHASQVLWDFFASHVRGTTE